MDIFEIPETRFRIIAKDPNGLESALTYMRRIHPTLGKTADGKGIIIHDYNFGNLLLDGKDFPDLEYLNLADSSCDKITLMGNFPKLQHLDLSNCQLKSILFAKAEFPMLQQWYLRQNDLKSFVLAADCPHLKLLDLGENPFLESIRLDGDYPKLEYLYFYKKKERDDDKKLNVPIQSFAFKSIPQLKVLDFENSQLQQLPDNFLELDGLETLYLSGCNPKDIPESVIGKGERSNAVKDLFTYLASKADTYLHQSKMFMIGNGEVGKTSIRKKLLDSEADLETKENRTNTIDVVKYPIKLSSKETGLPNQIDYRIDIWDFGGQDKYREIQQLFCSPKSLYVYVTSHDDESKEDYIGYEYWLSMAKAYGYDEQSGKNSPMLFVVNKCDEQEKPVDEISIKGAFSNEIQFFKLSAANYDARFQAFEEAIRRSLGKTSDGVFKDKFNRQWLDVKEKLEKSTHSYISIQTYLDDFCEEIFEEKEDALSWLRILDRIGTVIYFGTHEKLKDWVVLKPEWLKVALAKVIEAASKSYGVVLESTLTDDIWKGYKEEEQDKFKELLTKYKLAFKKKNEFGDDIFVVPSALSTKAPALPSVLKVPSYQLKFAFDPFVPAGTVSRLTVGLFDSGFIYGRYYWKKNVILWDETQQSYAHIYEDWQNHAVMVSFYGKQSGTLYRLIINELSKNNEEIKTLRQMSMLDFRTDLKLNDEWISMRTVKHLKLKEYAFLWDETLAGKMTSHTPSPSIASSRTVPDGALWNISQGKMNILFVGANPSGTSPLNLEKEKNTISDVLKDGNVELSTKSSVAATIKWLEDTAIYYAKPVIIHIAGHGIPDLGVRQELANRFPGLSLEKESGILFFSEDLRQTDTWTASRARDLIKSKKDHDVAPIGLVVLNNCYSEPMAKTISEANVYVIGLKDVVKDDIAIRFSELFYGSINKLTQLNQTSLVQALKNVLSSLPVENQNNIVLFYKGKEIQLINKERVK